MCQCTGDFIRGPGAVSVVMNIIGLLSDQFDIALDLGFEFVVEFISVGCQMVMVIFVGIQCSVFSGSEERAVFMRQGRNLIVRQNRRTSGSVQINTESDLIQIRTDPFHAFFDPGHIGKHTGITDDAVLDPVDTSLGNGTGNTVVI